MGRSDRNVLQDTFRFQLSTAFQFYCYIPFTEVESLKTHFEVLGPEALSPQKLPCPRLEDSVCLESLKICRSFFVEKFVFLRSPEKNF